MVTERGASGPPISNRKLFTVEEADALLPSIVPLLESLREAASALSERQAAMLAAVPGNGGGRAGRELLEVSQTAAGTIAELQSQGIVVRDPTTGLVDFPSLREGREVLLCWRLGEDRVAWWHPTTSGFTDRRPL